MLIPNRSSQFKRDFKLAIKRGRDISKIEKIMRMLTEEIPLDSKHRDHSLSGDYKAHRECHIEPDWLLIYVVTAREIFFVRTGTHSDLFK
jgi:mRNA interferase YafQ